MLIMLNVHCYSASAQSAAIQFINGLVDDQGRTIARAVAFEDSEDHSFLLNVSALHLRDVISKLDSHLEGLPHEIVILHQCVAYTK